MEMQIKRPNLDRLDFFKTKDILNQDNDSEEIIDILDINKTSVYFKRAQLAVFKSTRIEDKIQLLLFDRLIPLSDYDELIDDSTLSKLIDISMESKAYYSSPEIISFKNDMKENDVVSDEDPYEKFEGNIQAGKKDIRISIPFTEWDVRNTRIDMIEDVLRKKIKVELTFSGELLPTNYVLKRISQLEELSSKYGSLSLNHRPNLQPLCVNTDGYLCGCIDYIEHVIPDSQGDIIINEPRYYDLSQDQYKKIFNQSEVGYQTSAAAFKNTRELKIMLKKIIDEFYLFDQKQKELNRKTWLSSNEKIAQDHESFERIPFVRNRNDYEIMLTAVNKFLFESLKEKYRASYFFGDFKRYYPELFNFINKNRLYRNAVQHTRLDNKDDRKQLAEYLDKDTSGKYPGLINKGYAAMQYLLLNELLSSLRNEKDKLI